MAFEQPNYTQAPNAFFDEILKEIDSMAELKVTLAVIRHTMGFHRDEHELSLSYLVEYTGMKRDTVIDGLKRAMRRGTVGRRESGNTYAYFMVTAPLVARPKVVRKSDQGAAEGSPDTGPVGSPDTGPKKERGERKNEEVTNVPSSAASEDAPENSVMEMGRFGVKELAERVKAKRDGGGRVHSPTEREKRDFGAQFRQIAKDGGETPLMLLALDYMVAKASGEVENEPAAWCGYRTAFDRVVLDGWRPKGVSQGTWSAAERERVERENEENRAMLEEILAS